MHAINDESDTRNQILRVPGISQKCGLEQFEQGFSSVLAKFSAYLIMFQKKISVPN